MEPADNSVSYEAKGTGDSRVSYKTMKLQTVGCPTKLVIVLTECPTKLWNYTKHLILLIVWTQIKTNICQLTNIF